MLSLLVLVFPSRLITTGKSVGTMVQKEGMRLHGPLVCFSTWWSCSLCMQSATEYTPVLRVIFRAKPSPLKDNFENMTGDMAIWAPYLTWMYQYMIDSCPADILHHRTCPFCQNPVLNRPEHPRAWSWKYDVKWPPRLHTSFAYSGPWLRDLIYATLIDKCTHACGSALWRNLSESEPRS